MTYLTKRFLSACLTSWDVMLEFWLFMQTLEKQGGRNGAFLAGRTPMRHSSLKEPHPQHKLFGKQRVKVYAAASQSKDSQWPWRQSSLNLKWPFSDRTPAPKSVGTGEHVVWTMEYLHRQCYSELVNMQFGRWKRLHIVTLNWWKCSLDDGIPPQTLLLRRMVQL